ncbi:MAG: hypothetical protein OJF49_002472 [Ktedonobacterales bacterium]|jgi:predicted metal-binding membrane protein|nr:MAG: hypothetical protein OJF49_002472 [Ktedonobacterales bacterium]
MASDLAATRHLPLRFRWPWLFVGAGWALAILATITGWRILIDHHFLLEESGLSWPVAAAVFLVGWQVMIVAMMLPASMPTITTLLARGGAGARAKRQLAVFFAGYAAIWTAFGLLAFAGDTLIHRTVDAWPWLATHAFLIGAITFLIAGLFQFSRGKRACLSLCRSPHAFIADSGPAPSHTAWRLGIWHGAASVGCCWALMLVMFGIGVGNLVWMAGLTCLMASETTLPTNRWMSRAIGITSLVLALLWLAHPAWLVPATVS